MALLIDPLRRLLSSPRAASLARAPGALLLWALLSLGLSPLAVAQTSGEGGGGVPDDAAEYEIKAAYLYNFAQFIHWYDLRPEFPVCVLGDDPFGPALDALRGEPVGEEMRVVLRFGRDMAALRGCRVIFISASERDRLRGWLQVLDEGVLTVGDWPGFAAGGGVIELYQDVDRVHFIVNSDAVARSGLAISAQLLDLARITRDGDGVANAEGAR